MKRSALIIMSAVCVLFAGCSRAPVTDPTDEADSFSSAAAEFSSVAGFEGIEATYQGMVDELGVTIYQQGTHRLTLRDGSFLLLESDIIDLDAVLGQTVEVTGMVRSTVEAGAQIMHVQLLRLLEEFSSSSVAGEMFSSEMQTVSSAGLPASSRAPVLPVSSRRPEVRSSAPRQAFSSVQPVAAASSAISGSLSAEMEERVRRMARERGPESWTQQYCSSHIGLRFPVRNDWWYHSFGTTTSYLWHVELSSEEIHTLGEGPIAVNLVQGRWDGTGGEVVEQDGMVIGYRPWSDNRHIEVVAPVALRSAVQFIVNAIGTCDAPVAPSSSASQSSF